MISGTAKDFTIALLLSQLTRSQVLFEKCSLEEYYSDFDNATLVSSLSRKSLETLVQTTHRRVLPYNDINDDDVWKALIDLDGNDKGEVRLIYRNIFVNANPYGTPDSWNREHLWPKSKGIYTEGADYTDTHHLRPADWNVNAARSNKYFGACLEQCSIPASSEAANDTAAGPDRFLPPAAVRGDIARALFYMDLRYSGSLANEADLVLTNCPSQENEMAFLNELVKWHRNDPPSDDERDRNLLACQRWQGNRNPFVDYPELVNSFFPHSSDCLAQNNTQQKATCSNLSAGSVMVIGVNSDNPDTVALVALTEIPHGVNLFMTDNAWTGSNFRTNEGTIQLRLSRPIESGQVFGYGESSNLLYHDSWQPVAGAFELSTAGDSILVYCQEESGSIVFLSGISLSTSWLESGLPENDYGTQDSAVPLMLEEHASIALRHQDNYQYAGPREGPGASLAKSISSPRNWRGSNNNRFSFSDSFFHVTSSGRSFHPSHVTVALVVVLLLRITSIV